MGFVTLRRDGPIATITLDRPEKHHALLPSMLDEIEDHAASIDADPAIRAVVLTSTGDRAFCVGADLEAWSDTTALDVWRRWVIAGHRSFDRLRMIRQPIIAAIRGAALGGGLELSLAADIRIAHPDATFAMPEVTIGTVPGWGGTGHLGPLVGMGRARYLVLTGQAVDAPTALSWGLISGIAEDGAVDQGAHELARRIADHAPVAVQLAKTLLSGIDSSSSVRTLEAMAGAIARSTDDADEGVAAFRARRRAAYVGR